MIKFEENGVVFNLRTAGIIIEDGYVFLERKESDDFWSIPGGRTEFMEETYDTVIREYKEELNAIVKPIRQVYLTEDFFVYEKSQYHEIGFYYLTELVSREFADKNKTYIGKEGREDLIYKWFNLELINNIKVYPKFLEEGLLNIPDKIEKIIQK
ncbi:NUDIX domain-containing protein [uncultured Clostridium sp.]|jgi:8-oxo-dGTP pyrophosphatase MutT (NUDIX family)|uniref:NUDIX hydrolase n=1 Tax=uncultured Clostridium sp. TaxID=59620 RepID=UPI00260A9986|nr:NUDIX domain-containing protein [uncultured Clostridium sp.]